MSSSRPITTSTHGQLDVLVYGVGRGTSPTRGGGRVLPINFRLAPAEWRYILEHGNAVAVVTEAMFEADLADAAEDLPISLRLSVNHGTTPTSPSSADRSTMSVRSTWAV